MRVHTRSDRSAQTRSRIVQAHAHIAELTGVDLPLRLWDGEHLGPADAGFVLVLSDERALRALLWPPSDVTAGEAYVYGWIEIDGDAVAAMATGERLAAAFPRSSRARLGLAADVLRLPRPPRHPTDRRAHLRGRLHSLERDRAAIAFHYDLPERFYETFLDERLVYSCAYFAPDDDNLARAQRRKLDLVCRKLRLAPGQRLLDIGCGWGSLLIYAAEHYGVDATGVTLSRTQAEAGARMISERGLAHRARIELRDYREVDGHYDAVASVGMAEHVGPDNLPAYSATARRLLRPGGPFLCHSIVTGDAQHVRRGTEDTFLSAYVFPDGGLVPPWRLILALQQGGFEVVDVEQLRPHYAKTLRLWISNLEAHHDEAIMATSEVDYRIWRAYMGAAAHSFDTGALGVVQVLSRVPGGQQEWPRGRAWMLTEQ